MRGSVILALSGVAIGSAVLAFGNAALAQAPDARAKAAFQTCAACHSDKPGISRLGPSLAGIYGQPAGKVQGFRYSPAMSSAKIRWDRATLDAFIANPKSVVPGTRMSYPGVNDAAKRQAIITYLQSLGPVPAK